MNLFEVFVLEVVLFRVAEGSSEKGLEVLAKRTAQQL